MTRYLLIALVAVGLSVTTVDAQTLYTMDGAATVVLHQESAPPAGPCGAPNPLGVPPWPYGPSPCPFGPALLPVAPPPAGILGDVAVDRLADLVYVTDGVAISEHTGDPPCPGAPGMLLNTYAVPPIPTPAGLPLGPLTGMGMDAVAGIMWVTDGAFVAGLGGFGAPPGTCLPLGIAVPAFPHPAPGAIITDVTWDPFTGSLWACDIAGTIYNFFPGGAPGVAPFVIAPGPCGLIPILQGIAYDMSTPGATVPFPALYVTDGMAIVYIDITTGAPVPAALSPFHTPVSCGFSFTPTNGLAYSGGGITYGVPRVAMTIGSFGHSTSPSATWGFEVTGTPPATLVWIVANFSPPGPGFACPPIPSAGTLLWVSPFAPAIITPLFGAPPGCTAIPTPLPAAIPPGIEIFVQFVAIDPTTGIARDATEGLEFTIMAP